MSGDHNINCSANNKTTRRVRAGGPPPADDAEPIVCNPKPKFNWSLVGLALLLGVGLGSLVYGIKQFMDYL